MFPLNIVSNKIVAYREGNHLQHPLIPIFGPVFAHVMDNPSILSCKMSGTAGENPLPTRSVLSTRRLPLKNAGRLSRPTALLRQPNFPVIGLMDSQTLLACVPFTEDQSKTLCLFPYLVLPDVAAELF
jgi:hypothetical protein